MDTAKAPPTTRDELSDEQWIADAVVTTCSSALSVVGSSIIVFKILRDRAQSGSMTPYDRIVLGLSGCDLVASVTWVIRPFLFPIESHVWAFGNAATCQVAGFLIQLSLSAWWYNCLLSYYFLLTVLSQVRRKNIVRRFELFMHLSVLFFPITGTIGLYLGWYGDGNCRIMDQQNEFIVSGIPTFFTLLSLIVNNIVIYAIVRKSLRSSSEHGVGLTSVQKRLKREATTLMFLYVGCFFVTLVPGVVRDVLESNYSFTEDDPRLFPVLILDAMLRPLQGFLNFFIYIKPMYTRFRAANPSKPIKDVLHQALFDPNVPQSNHSTNLSTSTDLANENAANPNRVLFKSDFRPHSSSSNSSSSSDSSDGGHSDHNSEEDGKEEE